MSNNIVNENRIITITPQGPWVPAVPVYVEIKAGKCKAGGSFVLVDKITWTISGCVLTGYNPGNGSGQLIGSATKVKCNNKQVILENDSGFCSGTFVTPTPPTPPTVAPCSCEYKITYAGQNKSKGI
jgi:hypothetical protein